MIPDYSFCSTEFPLIKSIINFLMNRLPKRTNTFHKSSGKGVKAKRSIRGLFFPLGFTPEFSLALAFTPKSPKGDFKLSGEPWFLLPNKPG